MMGSIYAGMFIGHIITKRRHEHSKYTPTQIEEYECLANDKCGNYLDDFRRCMIENNNFDMCEKEMYMLSHCFSTNGIPIE